MKYLLTILLCLALSGCAFLKDMVGGYANVPDGFELTHMCIFVSPAQGWVVGFKLTTPNHTEDRCGQVIINAEKASAMSKNELAEYVLSQAMMGLFIPCGKEAKGVTVQP